MELKNHYRVYRSTIRIIIINNNNVFGHRLIQSTPSNISLRSINRSVPLSSNRTVPFRFLSFNFQRHIFFSAHLPHIGGFYPLFVCEDFELQNSSLYNFFVLIRITVCSLVGGHHISRLVKMEAKCSSETLSDCIAIQKPIIWILNAVKP
jgi:hypothetical protein